MENPQTPSSEIAPTQPSNPSPAVDQPSTTVTEEQVWAALRQCFDPEIPVNLVDLGLIYDVALSGNRVDVKMTLTAPGCMMGGQIAGDAQSKLLSIEGIDEASVELVWDPPWHQSMISAEGRKILGME
jgi:metal-sulfur cluster biosynthetic enzyme